MAMTKEENDLITKVEGDAPLGGLLKQHFWLPAAPASKLEADGTPLRIRLVGENYVLFRNTDGELGLLDELCPHRKVSLALGRNEKNGLRCIYHGWNFDVNGNLIDAPNVEGDKERFCKSVKTNKYKVVEKGGIAWVWLGKGDTPPPFPELPFTNLPEEQRAVASVVVPTNWLQGVEASMDTTHVSWLHSSTTEIGGNTQRKNLLTTRAAKFEFEDRPYGFRYVALRTLPDEQIYARVNNFVAPWYGVICPPEEMGPSTVFFSVPIDDTHHRAWFVHFNTFKRLGMTNISSTPDVWNFPPLPPGDADNNWGQNRDLMKRGHFSGFPQHLATEDFAMFLSQGAIHDRTTEQLCMSDAAIVRLRRILLEAVRDFEDGKTPSICKTSVKDYQNAISVGGVVKTAEEWRTLVNA